jgi:hypothetical protein
VHSDFCFPPAKNEAGRASPPSPIARKAIDFERIERAIQNWLADGWPTRKIVGEYKTGIDARHCWRAIPALGRSDQSQWDRVYK